MKKLALTVLVCLALPSTALAKGPAKALIAGPGMPAIRISGAEGSSTPFWHFVEAAGFFEAAWGSSQLPQTPPHGELGPRYTITWAVPSSSRLHQELYPYAKPYPLTYMARGQRIYGNRVEGGWFSGRRKLERALLRIGVPARPPAVSSIPSASPPAPRSPSGSTVPIPALAAMSAAIAILALASAARSLRRRSSGAAGT
jgi:hypothetical protein